MSQYRYTAEEVLVARLRMYVELAYEVSRDVLPHDRKLADDARLLAGRLDRLADSLDTPTEP